MTAMTAPHAVHPTPAHLGLAPRPDNGAAAAADEDCITPRHAILPRPLAPPPVRKLRRG